MMNKIYISIKTKSWYLWKPLSSTSLRYNIIVHKCTFYSTSPDLFPSLLKVVSLRWVSLVVSPRPDDPPSNQYFSTPPPLELSLLRVQYIVVGWHFLWIFSLWPSLADLSLKSGDGGENGIYCCWIVHVCMHASELERVLFLSSFLVEHRMVYMAEYAL